MQKKDADDKEGVTPGGGGDGSQKESDLLNLQSDSHSMRTVQERATKMFDLGINPLGWSKGFWGTGPEDLPSGLVQKF